VISVEAWQNRDAWGRDEWNTWETWGWYRQFVRVVSEVATFFSSSLFSFGILVRWKVACYVFHLISLILTRYHQYAPYLRKYTNTLETVSFVRLNGMDGPAVNLLKKLWYVATGQE